MQVRRYFLAALLTSSLLCVSTVSAFAQSRELVNRLNRLENDVQTLNEAFFRGNVKPSNLSDQKKSSINHLSPSQSAQIEVRLSAMERELRDLTGIIEEINYRSQQTEAKVEKYLADANLRFQDIEAKLHNNAVEVAERQKSKAAMQRVEVTDPKPDPVTLSQVNQAAPNQGLQPKSLISSGNEAVAYEQAFGLLRQGQYDQAEAAFKTFLEKFPDDELASNAQYWLSETYYVRGMFEPAARGFAVGYRQYPNASKKADNLLKLGLSLAALEKTQDACVTFDQLAREVPNAPPPIKRRAEQEKAKLNCE